MAISELYNCRLEVYEKSENPRVVNAWDFQGSNNPPIRLFYRNSHYTSVSSSGGQSSNFQTIGPGEMEQKMLTQCQFLKSKNFQNNSTQSVGDLSIADPELHYAIQLSKATKNQENHLYVSTLNNQRNYKTSNKIDWNNFTPQIHYSHFLSS